MTKGKVQEATTEELALLDELSGGKADSGAKLPYLAVNIASEDGEGKEIPVKTFNLVGTDSFSKTIKFRPLAFYNKLIAMTKDGTKWKTTNETIFYQKEQPVDARGGLACGRLLGRSVPESWTEEQKRANKQKANYYGFLFGYVEFPNKEPVLCNFRLPAGKAMQISQVLNDLERNHGGKFQVYRIDMKLITNPKDKSSPHPVLEISPDLTQVLSISGTGGDLLQIKEYVTQHNARIKSSFQNAQLARNSLKSDFEVTAAVEDDDNSIPF